jgi:hypothetical protein
MYVTKYLSKFPEMGYPIWVRNSSRIRFFQACRALGAIVGNQKPWRTKVKGGNQEKKIEGKSRRATRTLAEREAECGMRSIALIERPNADGPPSYEYLGTLLVRPGRLVRLVERGELLTPLVVETKCFENESEGSTWLVPVLPRQRGLTQVDQFLSVCRELVDKGETIRCVEDIEQRQRMLEENSKWRGRVDGVTGPVITPDDGMPFRGGTS